MILQFIDEVTPIVQCTVKTLFESEIAETGSSKKFATKAK